MAETVYISLGSNIGDREKSLESAINMMKSIEGLELIATSATYISDPVEMPVDSPSFLNMVAKTEYAYSPLELLNALEAIEVQLGRTDKGKNLPRTIDLDILLYGEQIIDTEKLCIPHTELIDRPFVLIPLVQIDPDLKHPANGRMFDDFITDEDRNQIIIFRDHVARNV